VSLSLFLSPLRKSVSLAKDVRARVVFERRVDRRATKKRIENVSRAF